MVRFQPYSTYKQTKSEWLGCIPEHWREIQIKHLTSVKRGASPRPIDDPKYFDEDGEYAWVRIADVSASERYLETTTQRLSEVGQNLSVKMLPGNLFLSIAGTVGKPIITRIKCCIHDGFVYFPDLKENTEYLYYIFACGQPYLGLGKMGTQLNLNTDTVGSIVVGLPFLPEQDNIVRFLDYKTGQIDALIAKKEALLAKLAEKRTALINHAVTKGLDPSAPMKDSGVAWLGEIPTHWELVKLGRKIQLQRGVDITKDEQCKGVVPVVSSGGVASYHNVAYAKGPGVLVGRKGTAGSVYFIDSDYWPHDTTLWVKEFRDNDPRYVFYKLCSMNLASFDTGSANPTINRNLVHPTIVSWPPSGEQKQIVSYLDSQTINIDQQCRKVQAAVEKLQEYRAALITNAVTGKIDVRQFAPRQPGRRPPMPEIVPLPSDSRPGWPN